MSVARVCMSAMVMFDVVEEILLRLPVKDLLRCKSVCKSWYSLISSHSFAKIHEKFICNKVHMNNKQLGNRRIAKIRCKEYTCRNGKWCPDEWNYYFFVNIEGSSNGLVCISKGNRLSLTNPLTREFRHLPKPPINVYEERCYGFGYDSSIDNCKLVMAIIKKGCYRAFVQILSLKSIQWKRCGYVNYIFHDWKPGILCNGALHWFWFDAVNYTRKKLIVSFDLAKEEFIEISQPDDTRYVPSDKSSLGIIEDRLCIFQPPNNGRTKVIWVMKNYNVKPCWELLPDDYEMKDNVLHYMKMITDCYHWEKSTFFCDDNTMHLSRDAKYIGDPLFVQTLVSPYSSSGKSSYTKNKNRRLTETQRKDSRNIKKRGSKEKREIDEILLQEGEDGKKKRKINI